MKRATLFLLLITAGIFLFPQTSPAPIVWHPDTGWQTEGKVPILDNPKAQIEAAKKCEEKKDWENALNNYRVMVRLWPQSPFAPQARYGEARMYEQLGDHYKAFKSYQKLIEKYPNDERFDQILRRQIEIGDRFLKGERLKFLGVKTLPSMDKTVEMFEKIIANGPYSEVAPLCQLKIGQARDKQKEYDLAVHAYQKVIDEYPTSPVVPDAYYHIGHSYYQQALRAEYDQSAADNAALAFEDFLSRYPDHNLAKEVRSNMGKIQAEQARGLWQIAQFYDRTLRDSSAALVYYNDLIANFPSSSHAIKSKPRLEELKQKLTVIPAAKKDNQK